MIRVLFLIRRWLLALFSLCCAVVIAAPLILQQWDSPNVMQKAVGYVVGGFVLGFATRWALEPQPPSERVAA